ncbi:MAG: hypothetical protein AMXMBFR84_48160 [Candidatus Hydrogenedentota bacterium]
MSTIAKPKNTEPAVERPFARHTIEALIGVLCTDVHARAIKELLEHRTPFVLNGNENRIGIHHLITYCIERCATSSPRPRTEILDAARDLTLDKFTNLPPEALPEKHRERPSVGTDDLQGEQEAIHWPKTDRRKYYKALANAVLADQEVNRAQNSLERESAVCAVFQRFVLRHIGLSLQEATRKFRNPFESRYAWKIPGKGTITVYLPKYLSGPQRPAWLRENVDDPCPGRKGERERVQSIINERLAVACYVSDPAFELGCASSTMPNPRELAARSEYPNLARYFAEEKSACLDALKPSIRKCGADGVRTLVIARMQSLTTGQKNDATLAREAGVSKAAYSRFAGSKWNSAMPDLWRNVAREISRDPILREMAERAGVYRAAVEALGHESNPDSEVDHEP